MGVSENRGSVIAFDALTGEEHWRGLVPEIPMFTSKCHVRDAFLFPSWGFLVHPVPSGKLSFLHGAFFLEVFGRAQPKTARRPSSEDWKSKRWMDGVLGKWRVWRSAGRKAGTVGLTGGGRDTVLESTSWCSFFVPPSLGETCDSPLVWTDLLAHCKSSPVVDQVVESQN